MKEELPIYVFNKSIDELREIFTWNRALSNLNSSKKIKNAISFLKNELFEVKGPYVEYVAEPKLAKKEFGVFCRELGVDEAVIKAYETVLFRNSKTNYLYKHQSEFIESVFTQNNYDITLSVPTASGKTESFLLPILDVCVKDRTNSLKAILFYPTKTLAVDQLNRLIKYIRVVNLYSDRRAISVGIWDGDTKQEVGNGDNETNVIQPGSIIRGIKCPDCSTKLRINKGEIVYCPNCDFDSSWIKVTRKAIKNGVDILITNPEAFDYLFIDPNEDKVRIIGENSFNENVKYVVFDEAHTWTGASGSAIHMLCQRLRAFYGPNLKFFIVSATMGNPKSFGTKLTGRENITIEFEPEKITYDTNNANLSRIPACFPENAFRILYLTLKNHKSHIDLSDIIDYDDKDLQLLVILNYISDKNSFKLNLDLSFLKKIELDSFETFIGSDLFSKDLRARVIKYMPEVLHLREFLLKKGKKPVTFTHFDEIVEKFTKKLDVNSIFTRGEYLIITISLLTIGRLAGLLQDRLHYFIRGNDGINYCDNCNLITSKKICDKCGGVVNKKLFFCSTCHNIFYSKIIETDEIDSENLDLRCDDIFELETDLPIKGTCPSCKTNIRRTNKMRDGSVYHPQLLSQFLSAYGRVSPSRKILVFADSRNLAEQVGYDFSENDYQIVSQKYMLKSLATPIKSHLLYGKTMQFINNQYYYPIYNSLKDPASREVWKSYQESKLKRFAGLNSATMLIDACLITPTSVLEKSSNDIQAILGHFLFRQLIQSGRFTKYHVKFEGYTLEKFLKNDLKIPYEEIIRNLPFVIKYLYESNFLCFIKKDIIEAKIRGTHKEEAKINELLQYFEEQTRNLNELLQKASFKIPNDCYGIFDRRNRVLGYSESRKNDYSLSKVNKIKICKICKKAYPLVDNSWMKCPLCEGEIISGDREENNGYLSYNTSVDIPYDYWGKQMQSINEIENDILTINVHRAGIPLELRSVIEDSFKDKNPKINIISATTTFELGIDIGDLDTVFLVGLPPGIANYIQRAGRAGRSKGHSSTVVTFIRSGNVIDDFYFEKLEERYFDSIPHTEIPDNKDVDIIFACHILTLICGYLARNYDSKNTYQKIWDVKPKLHSLTSFINITLNRVKLFSLLIKERKFDEINYFVNECYGEEAIKLLEKILDQDNDYSILKRLCDYFSHYRNIELSRESQNKLAESFRFFSHILSVVGYLANYRGFVGTIPIQNNDEDKLEEKSIINAIKENYPGHFNNNKEKSGKKYSGGYQLISMTPYITDKVYASKKILDTKVCNNKSCSYFQIKAEKALTKCILCNEELQTISVHAPEQIIIKQLPRDLGYKAYPHIVQDIVFSEITEEEVVITSTLKVSAFKSLANLITFVPSFRYRYKSSTSWEIAPSQAEIPEDIKIDSIHNKVENEKSFLVQDHVLSICHFLLF